jgi:cyclophilin family peptidyl-prolyl cis-trans isomerase
MKALHLSNQFLLLAILMTSSCSQTDQQNATTPVVILETSLGSMEITLNPDKAPGTVKNFLTYVNDGFYDGTIFHRVIYGFMIQGGGYTRNMLEKETRSAIKNEAENGLLNKRGTIAMALEPGKITSGKSQFFINLKDNDFLDHKGSKPDEFGYAVFGEVTRGIEVIDRIAEVETDSRDAPLRPVVIRSIKVKP